MQDDAKKECEAKAADLKSQLKLWEAEVARRNGGKKPSRDDIKQNPEIQAKYKQYQQIRDMLDGKPVREKKRKPEAAPAAADMTPTKRPRPQATPTATRRSHVDDFETPEIRRLFSPALPTSIGPTPQRDGRVLGLFDLLDDQDDDEKTPSKDHHRRPAAAAAVDARLQATPSKRKPGDAEPPAAVAGTPVATGRRALFKTPLKNRDGNAQGAPSTPAGNAAKLLFSTPSFLRRGAPPAAGDPAYASPRRPRLPRKPPGRGLSSVVADLRRMEEAHLDDDMEALREMEGEEDDDDGGAAPARKPAPPPPRLLGGFDDEDALDSEPEPELDRDGRPLRVYKKKGQKRTTRRVNMRPTRARRPGPTPGEDAGASDAETDDGDGDAAAAPRDPAASGSDYDGAADGSGDEGGEGGARTTAKKKKEEEEAGGDSAGPKAGAVKKAARKVNELAHANFKRLKLRNHGAKGGPGFGSRFRRRR